MLLQILLFGTLALNLTPAFAAENIAEKSAVNHVDQISTCVLQGDVTYSHDTQIACDGDLVIAEGAHLTLEGEHELQVFVHGAILYPQSGLRVTNEGALLVSAMNASGLLKVDGGHVSLEYATLNDYDQELRPDSNSGAEMVLNGQAVTLVGPMLKPAL